MALSDKEILEQMERGNLIIEPFERANLSTSSYDVRLGDWHFTEHLHDFPGGIYNPRNKLHTDLVWGTVAKQAGVAREVLPTDFEFEGINPDDQVIVIGPGETILGHTQEFIGGRIFHTTKMQARSTIGRNFLEVCKCAGWGDVGFFNKWTMEITNNSRRYSIVLPVGIRIAQIVFFKTGEILERDYSSAGKYQGSNVLEDVIHGWSPDQMLPKLYLDREIRRKS